MSVVSRCVTGGNIAPADRTLGPVAEGAAGGREGTPALCTLARLRSSLAINNSAGDLCAAFYRRAHAVGLRWQRPDLPSRGSAATRSRRRLLCSAIDASRRARMTPPQCDPSRTAEPCCPSWPPPSRGRRRASGACGRSRPAARSTRQLAKSCREPGFWLLNFGQASRGG